MEENNLGSVLNVVVEPTRKRIRLKTIVSGIACQPTSNTMVVLVGFIRVVQLTVRSSRILIVVIGQFLNPTEIAI